MIGLSGWTWKFLGTDRKGAGLWDLVWTGHAPVSPRVVRKQRGELVWFVLAGPPRQVFKTEAALREHLQRAGLGPWDRSGDELKERGIQDVLANERQEWMEGILRYVKHYAERHETFYGEDIRRTWLEVGGVPPHHHNVWGAVMTMAAKQGLVEKTGAMRNAKSAATHAHPVAEWRLVPPSAPKMPAPPEPQVGYVDTPTIFDVGVAGRSPLPDPPDYPTLTEPAPPDVSLEASLDVPHQATDFGVGLAIGMARAAAYQANVEAWAYRHGFDWRRR